MHVWNVLHTARCTHRTQKSRQKSPSGHHRTTLSGYIFATKARVDNRKKFVKQQYVLQMCPQYSEFRPTGDWDRFTSLGTPANFNGFRDLAALLHGSRVVSVSQTLQHWTEGATYVWQGDRHVGPHSSLLLIDLLFVIMCINATNCVLTHSCNWANFSVFRTCKWCLQSGPKTKPLPVSTESY